MSQTTLCPYSIYKITSEITETPPYINIITKLLEIFYKGKYELFGVEREM